MHFAAVFIARLANPHRARGHRVLAVTTGGLMFHITASNRSPPPTHLLGCMAVLQRAFPTRHVHEKMPDRLLGDRPSPSRQAAAFPPVCGKASNAEGTGSEPSGSGLARASRTGSSGSLHPNDPVLREPVVGLTRNPVRSSCPVQRALNQIGALSHNHWRYLVRSVPLLHP